MKSTTTSPLLRHISFLAKRCQNDPNAPLSPEGRGLLKQLSGRPLKHSQWLQHVARDLGLEYNQVSQCNARLTDYCDHNAQKRIWNTPVSFFYQPEVFERQLQALLDASEGKFSLAEAAKKQRVTFENFDFSPALLDFLVARKGVSLLSFEGISASSSVIADSWVSICTSFAGADLSNAKFVRYFDDGQCRAGMMTHEGKFMAANLSGADLRWAYLRGADFSGANLEGTDLRNANVYESCIQNVTGALVGGEVDSTHWLLDEV
ncbi:Pentapeptide repeats (8 copies) [compost metagenome]